MFLASVIIHHALDMSQSKDYPTFDEQNMVRNQEETIQRIRDQ